MKKKLLALCMVLGLFAMPIQAVMVTSENINTVKPGLEKDLQRGNELNSYDINHIISSAKSTDRTLSAQQKAELNQIVNKAVNIALNKGDKYYANGDDKSALQYYQIVLSNKKLISNNDLIKVNLNKADILMKKGTDGSGIITDCIALNDSDSRIIPFIDNHSSYLKFDGYIKIARKYASKKQYSNALKYYNNANKLAETDIQKNTVSREITECKQQQEGKTVENKPRTYTYDNTKQSQPENTKEAAMLKAAISKYNYQDYKTALSDLENIKSLNPALTSPSASNYYDVLYPIFVIPLKNYNAALKSLDKLIAEQKPPFNLNGSNYRQLLELRASLNLAQKNYDKAIEDYDAAIKLAYTDYESAFRGLIISYLIKGDLENAKAQINRFDKRGSYYKIADCTTYPNKIILFWGYEKFAYSSDLNDGLVEALIFSALQNYAYIVNRFYNDIWGGTSIEINDYNK